MNGIEIHQQLNEAYPDEFLGGLFKKDPDKQEFREQKRQLKLIEMQQRIENGEPPRWQQVLGGVFGAGSSRASNQNNPAPSSGQGYTTTIIIIVIAVVLIGAGFIIFKN